MEVRRLPSMRSLHVLQAPDIETIWPESRPLLRKQCVSFTDTASPGLACANFRLLVAGHGQISLRNTEITFSVWDLGGQRFV